MTSFAIDLHNHMPQRGSDYRGPMGTSGADVVRAALAAGLDVLGATDHFALDFYHEVLAAAEGTGLLVLPGLEMRLSWGGEEAHLIATFPQEGAGLRVSELLDAVGFRAGEVTCPLHRVVLECDPVEAACLADGLGAMVHVAHVDRWFGAYRLLGGSLLHRLIEESPVVAVEFLDLANATELGRVAQRVSLIQSSDSHCTDEIGRRSTMVEADALTFEALRRALAHAHAN